MIAGVKENIKQVLALCLRDEAAQLVYSQQVQCFKECRVSKLVRRKSLLSIMTNYGVCVLDLFVKRLPAPLAIEILICR